MKIKQAKARQPRGTTTSRLPPRATPSTIHRGQDIQHEGTGAGDSGATADVLLQLAHPLRAPGVLTSPKAAPRTEQATAITISAPRAASDTGTGSPPAATNNDPSHGPRTHTT
ncbi:MAG: hypothetical protein MPW13_06195 [Candidatus Manganitrophus sp.]|nr:hypothetical protein [Candidatus Manganitrophus sp.]